jgi:hypothetical protein
VSGFTDALIAAAAAEHGGIALLHRDTHFDVTQKAGWVLWVEGRHSSRRGSHDACEVASQVALSVAPESPKYVTADRYPGGLSQP